MTWCAEAADLLFLSKWLGPTSSRSADDCLYLTDNMKRRGDDFHRCLGRATVNPNPDDCIHFDYLKKSAGLEVTLVMRPM